MAFDEAFLAQLGVQPWQLRSGAEIKAPKPKPKEPLQEEATLPVVEVVAEQLEETSELVEVDSVQSPKADILPFILIGEGLDAIWQDETQVEWALLENIAQALSWDMEKLHYFDTAHIVSEEAIYATLEEVMEMDINLVLSMSADSSLSEYLQEGLQVLDLPSLSDMLADPYAKKQTYSTLMQAGLAV